MKTVKHPNGFTIHHLAPVDYLPSRLRLHVWDAEGWYGDPHSHRWQWESEVLVGALVVVTYEAIPGDRYDRYEYSPDDELVPAGASGLKHAGSKVIQAGERHSGEPGEIHMVRSLEPTVTLFRLGADEATPYVYRMRKSDA